MIQNYYQFCFPHRGSESVKYLDIFLVSVRTQRNVRDNQNESIACPFERATYNKHLGAY